MICGLDVLRNKEVINLLTGEKMGYVDDVEIDTQKATVVKLVIFGRVRGFGLLGRDEDLVIPYECIQLIGVDTILVKLGRGDLSLNVNECDFSQYILYNK